MIIENTLQIFTAVVKTFLALFDVKSADVIDVLVQRIRRFRAPGQYEVLEHEVSLELNDAMGEVATYHKRQQVRFLQDNIIAYQDNAWGDGNIFAKYQCSPGVAVDRYREGHRYRVLISLRGTKHRNDITVFHVDRTITGGFTKQKEEFQTEIDHLTRTVSMSVIFPSSRLPKNVILIEQNISRSITLSTDCFQVFLDGRVQVSWMKKRPRLFETYILRWTW